METPNTLIEAIRHFTNFENCKEFIVAVRWADGVVKCPTCGSEKVTYLSNARLWKCYSKHERPKFSLKTGTVFEDSPIGLEKWLPVMWMLVNCKNGISSYEVMRDLGVTQKTAWFMLHRGRLAVQDFSGGKLCGEVEVDETFIGGKARNMHRAKHARVITGSGGKDKAMVQGIVERGGKVRVMPVLTRKKGELQKNVRNHVEAGSAIFSDALKSYDGLSGDYQHAVIDHAVEYVRENVHTNTMENFWSLLKRGLHGTYVSVEPFHLFRYLDEQAFRYNNRNFTDAERFVLAMSGIVGKRLTYKGLIGKEAEDKKESAV